jgi:predicted DNA-binding transcriptional regulator
MLNTPYVKKDTIKNFFPVPNAVFDLGLHHMEINIYAYLLRIEDRRTYQCLVSYPTIARKLGISVNTVAKYVAALEEHGLIRTERTEIITRDGLKRNGCLRYTILPIKNALALCYERQMEKAGQAMERQRAQARAEKLGKEIVRVDGLDEILAEVKAQGRNLNQLTTLANMGRIQILRSDELIDGYADLCQKLLRISREVQ